MEVDRMTIGRITAGALAIGWLLAADAAWAAGLLSPESGGSKEPIEITADRLVSNNNEKWADFLGSVKAVQGKFTMTSDALRVYYSGDLMTPPKDRPMRNQVDKFVAKGHVRIVTDQYTTDSQQAEYVQATDILTLTGPNSKVVSGGNVITGPKIVLQRSEGKAVVEGAGTERVKAVFTQEAKEKGTDGAKETGAAPEGKPAEKTK
jgi:lipopolysaccharide transport protein LptA